MLNNFKNKLLKLFSYIYPAAKRGIKRFHGGIFPKHYKELSNRHPLTLSNIPKELVLPLKQHIGIEVEPTVKVGDKVLKNQLIADIDDKNLHAPIHAPTSGVIKAIENRQLPHVSGLGGLCIVVQTDGFDTEFQNPLQINGERPNSPILLKDIIYKAGIVGMGGAGFPTFAKLPNEKNKIKTLVINGAECEPFITCDDLLMQSYPRQIISGIQIVMNALGCENAICGIEDNKKQAINKMQQAAKKTNIEIRSIPTIYPMGGEKQLIKELLNLEIPARTHSIDSGILTMNVSTVRAIHQAVINGKPLTSRLVTISGLGINAPYNTEAMLGTPFNDLVKVAKPKTELNYPLIQGGPMMGFEVPNNGVPVIKTTNCVLANPPEQKAGTMPCIRCGECMDACPVNLLPQQLYWHARSQEFEKTEQLNLFDCIECGSCSFVCPSNIPLVQYYRFAKSEVKKQKIEQEAVDLAKLRHENKQAREEKLKVEKTARLKAKKDAIKNKLAESKAEPKEKLTDSKPLSARDKALAAAAKRKATKETGSNTEQRNPQKTTGKLSAREAALVAAEKRKAAKQSETNEPKATKKLTPREAALAAAEKRKAVKHSKTDVLPSLTKKTTPKEAALAATKKHQSFNTNEQTKVKDVKKEQKDRARDAAVKAARKRASLKKADKEVKIADKSPKKDPREAAVKAARKRAALRKEKKSEMAE